MLVLGMTGPEDVHLFNSLLLVCTVGGGVTCHASIMCRQMGVPAIVGIGDDFLYADAPTAFYDSREPNFEWAGCKAEWDADGNIWFEDGNPGTHKGMDQIDKPKYDLSEVPE